MSTLVDWQLAMLCQDNELVSPFDFKYINPASMDVTLGDEILIEGRICGPLTERTRWLPLDLRDFSEEDPYKLRPGNFILGVTKEVIKVPDWAEAQYQLKSTLGRMGIEHLMAGYIDPGFVGRITLELTNVNQRHDIPLWSGMRIGQLRFSRLDQTPNKTYADTGRYMNDMNVQPSKGIKVD